MREVIQRVAVGPDRGRDISSAEAEQVMTAILQGQINDVQTAVFLIALRMKRESLDECIGLFKALQNSLKPTLADVDELVCLADPFDGYVRHLPMSPFLPIVLAACGMPSLMHGVESVGPKHGITACKVYKLAGIDVQLDATSVAASISANGWSYIDQSQYASSLFTLQGLRDQIVKRTAVTTLERLLMPIKAQGKTHFVLGYVHKAYPQIYAAVAQIAGYDSALLIKGVEGGLTPALNKPLRRFYFDVSELRTMDFSNEEIVQQYKQVLNTEGLDNYKQQAEQIKQDSEPQGQKVVEDCLTIGLDVLSGKQSVARDSLCLAAGQILWAHKRADSLLDGIQKIAHVLDNGKAKSLFT